ncbi:MAG: SDR family oxidoreductase [Phycisphaerae bacterium]
MARYSWTDRGVVITGASSGIGRALAQALAPQRPRLALVARRADRLIELRDALRGAGCPNATAIALDLTAADAGDRLVEALRREQFSTDVLVNNAGAGEYGDFAAQDPAAVERMLRLNIDAVVRLTHALLPDMLQRRAGQILNVASLAGLNPFPFMSAYAASKAFVINFSLGLRAELADRGVVVSCLCPGTTRTEFFDHGGLEQRRGEFLKLGAEPQAVAQAALRGLAAGRALIVPGWSNRLSAVVQRHLPPMLLARLLAKCLRPGAAPPAQA